MPANWAPNVKLETETDAIGVVPVPVNVMLGLLLALVWSEIAADLAPVLLGANVMVAVHDAPGARLLAQLLVNTNCAASGPPRATPDSVRAAVPVFVTVNVCTAELEPIRWFPYDIELALTDAAGTADSEGPPPPPPPHAVRTTAESSPQISARQ